MRDRTKLSEKMNNLFEDSGPQTFKSLLAKQLYKPEVHVIVIGKSELESLFPSGSITSEALDRQAMIRVQKLGESGESRTTTVADISSQLKS